MSKFKIGDRVAVYGVVKPGEKGSIWNDFTCLGDHMIIRKIHESKWMTVQSGENLFLVHPKQCRKLVKKERRRVWIDKKKVELQHLTCHCYWVGKPDDDCIEFIEVKKK